jgi:HlyD family secretion protein
MRVKAKVGESDISHIEVGQKASFTLEAKQSKTFEGTIKEKRSQPDVINNVVTYTVLFEVSNPDGVLLPGLSVNVGIECVAKAQVPQIANAALRFKPPISSDERQAAIAAGEKKRVAKPSAGADGQPAAYCTEAWAWQFDESARRWSAVPLWVGITDNVNTEILAGARVGDRFVKKCTGKSESGYSFKDALKLASPENRSL